MISELYSSRDSEYPGCGYPSCNRALARISRQHEDANGYYADLGLPPWATDSEIKSALRDAFKKYHPDGHAPNAEKFLRFREIAEIFSDPLLKQRYDNTPPGEVFIDSEIRARLVDAGIPLDQIVLPFTDEIPGEDAFFDYLSLGYDPQDCLLAQDWYDALVDVAPLAHYTSSIRVLLCSNDFPDWLPRGKILMIPRWWKPCSRNAFALFFVKVGVV